METLRVGLLVLLFGLAELCAADTSEYFRASGVTGGVVVHAGCGDGRLTADLRVSDSFVVQGLDADVTEARKYLQSKGLYGPVSVRAWNGAQLPYVENFVNLLIVREGLNLPEEEIRRVLVPNGVAFRGGTKIVKPRPKEIDDWTHYLYGPENNAVSHDIAVGPPRHYQWIGSPRWSRHHDHMSSVSAVVAANGRLFYIVDEGSRAAIVLPSKWKLVARDAFNGTVLWTRDIPEWNTQLWPLKSGPNQLPRRLVASGERVYVTLGIDAPLSELDAASGQTLRTFSGTEQTDEILLSGDTLFALVASAPNRWKDYRPQNSYVWDNSNRANKDWAWDQQERRVMALSAKSGNAVWNREQRVAPLTLAVDAIRVYAYDGEKVVALSRQDGTPCWTSEPVLRKMPIPTGYGPSLVVQDGVVLLSVEQKAMSAFDAASGKQLWTAQHHPGGHASPDDMLVIGGLVWSGRIAGNKDDGLFTGRDLRTGEVRSEFPCDNPNYWFHHRCYRSKATDRYIITSRTGTEFVDLAAKHWDLNHWVRGACLYGNLPANGLLYAPAHPCGCYLESKLSGFNALAPERKEPMRAVADEERLQRGVAYSDPVSIQENAADWPTYRADGARSGAIHSEVAAELKLAWQTPVGGKLSSVTVAAGKVFVASMDKHSVYALDEASGRISWMFTAGARVDSPPTIWQGRVLFGSADGWVYSLRAEDGVLAWKYLAAPEERQMMAFEQLESVWPISGAVLVRDGVVYCVAGRSAFLDGGMKLLRLEAATGRKLSETVLDDRDPVTGESLQKFVKELDMPTALPDVLSCDAKSLYMRAQRFDLNGVRQEFAPMDPKEQTGEGVHLFSRSGFLDDTWWHRSFWLYGKGVKSGYGGWYQPGNFAPSGRLMVFDDSSLYSFDRKPMSMANAPVYDYYLYSASKETKPEGIQRVVAANNRINAASDRRSAASSDWALRKKFSLTELTAAGLNWAEGDLPLLARGMVLAGKTILVAGPPDLVDEEATIQNLDDVAIKARLEQQTGALDGQRGALLWAVSAADGKRLAAWQLDSMPVFDGMAAAQGKLFYAAADGKVICLAANGTALKPAPGSNPVPLDVSVNAITTVQRPSRDAEFAVLSKAHVFQSEQGYRFTADEKGIGAAAKKLDVPLTGKVTLKCRLQFTSAAGLKNGYLAFGENPEEAQWVKCGLRVAMKSSAVIQGPLAKNQGDTVPCDVDPEKTHELIVAVDLEAGRLVFSVGKVRVTAKLDRPMQAIRYVGYCSNNATVDVSPVEVSLAGK